VPGVIATLLPTERGTNGDVSTSQHGGVRRSRRSTARRSTLLPSTIVATAAAAALTLVRISHKSLWRDEGYTMSSVLRPWPSLWRLLWHTEANGFLYQIALKLWSDVSQSQGWMRSFSALATIATVPLVAALAHRLFDRRVAMVAPVLFVLNGSIVTFGQLARGYALATLLAVAATFSFVTLVERPSRRQAMWWALALVGLAGVHLIAALLLLAAHVVSLAGRPRATRSWRTILPAGAAVLVFAGAVGGLVSSHHEDQSLLKFGLGIFHDTLFVLSGRGGVAGVAAFLVLGLMLLLGAWWAWQAHGRSVAFWPSAVVLSCAALPPAVLAVVSVVRPVLLGRYLLFCLPALAIGAAAGAVAAVDRARPTTTAARGLKVGAVLVALVVVLGMARGIVYWHVGGGGVEDWRGAARLVEGQAQPRDGIVFADDWIRLFFEYYRNHPAGAGIDPTPVFPAVPWGQFRTEDVVYHSFGVADLDRLGPEVPRLWAVLGRDHTDMTQARAVLSGLDGTYHQVGSWLLTDVIEVHLYARTP